MYIPNISIHLSGIIQFTKNLLTLWQNMFHRLSIVLIFKNSLSAKYLSKVKAFYLCPQPGQFNPKRALDSSFGPHREDTHLRALAAASWAGMRTAGGRGGPGEGLPRGAGGSS